MVQKEIVTVITERADSMYGHLSNVHASLTDKNQVSIGILSTRSYQTVYQVECPQEDVIVLADDAR